MMLCGTLVSSFRWGLGRVLLRRGLNHELVQDEAVPTLNEPRHVALPDGVLVGKDEAECRRLRDGPHGPEEVPRLTRNSGRTYIDHVEDEGEFATRTVFSIASVI